MKTRNLASKFKLNFILTGTTIALLHDRIFPIKIFRFFWIFAADADFQDAYCIQSCNNNTSPVASVKSPRTHHKNCFAGICTVTMKASPEKTSDSNPPRSSKKRKLISFDEQPEMVSEVTSFSLSFFSLFLHEHLWSSFFNITHTGATFKSVPTLEIQANTTGRRFHCVRGRSG